jgi:molybdopterin-containing oxidoreductase family membrane subunit
MTLFALVQAGIFPLLHLGRPWFAYWLIPYPSTMRVWPQFRSSLTWDVVAITTYLTVSILFWYLGLVPDLATARDRAPTRARRIVYGVFALGWRGSSDTWTRYRAVYGLLGGLATPLVISVHSIVSMDFAIAQLPGWHSHIFPPFFVAGAILSGMAMVLTLMLPVRRLYRLEDVITERHLDMLARFTLVTSCIVGYSYAAEIYNAAYSGDPYEAQLFFNHRITGPFAWAFWITVGCNVLAPQLLWFRRARRSVALLFVVAICVQLGMWMERFLLIVSSQSHDFLPSSFRGYAPSPIDGGILVGSIGFFVFLMLVFLRYVPFIPIHEVSVVQREIRRKEASA